MSGNHNIIRNYCLIVKLSSLPTFFEKLIWSKLTSIFNNDIINEIIHGFRNGKSTCTNLLVYITNLFGTVKKKGQIEAIY